MAEVRIPTTQFNKMIRTIERLEKAMEVQDLISEDEASKLLGFSTTRTIQKKVCEGVITNDMYSKAPTGKRFYYKSKILGLK